MDALVALRSAVRAALGKFSPGDLILVAVSGGADSLALAEAAKLEADKLALKLIGININHQLQVGSEIQSMKVVEQLSFPCEVRNVTVELVDGLKSSSA